MDLAKLTKGGISEERAFKAIFKYHNRHPFFEPGFMHSSINWKLVL